jgi:hypothetical protein
MKILLFIASIILSGTCIGQIGADSPYEIENINQIILNYRDNGIEKFKVKYKYKFNSQRFSGFNFTTYYTFKNDSVFTLKNKNGQQNWIIRGNIIQYLSTVGEEKDTVKFVRNPNFIPHKISTDSANFSIEYYYVVHIPDSQITYKSWTIRDSLHRETEHIYWYSPNKENSTKYIHHYIDENKKIEERYRCNKQCELESRQVYYFNPKIVVTTTPLEFTTTSIVESTSFLSPARLDSTIHTTTNQVLFDNNSVNNKINKTIVKKELLCENCVPSIEKMIMTPKILRRKKKSS